MKPGSVRRIPEDGQPRVDGLGRVAEMHRDKYLVAGERKRFCLCLVVSAVVVSVWLFSGLL